MDRLARLGITKDEWRRRTEADPGWTLRDLEPERCPRTSYTGEPGTCRRCAKQLPRRKRDGAILTNRRWCSATCGEEWHNSHSWQVARAARLRLDGYRCQGCGVIGWGDVPHHVLPLARGPVEVTRRSATLDDWARALGLLDDLPELEWPHPDYWHLQRERDQLRKAALDQLPDSVRDLVAAENRLPRYRSAAPRWPGHLALEVNHRTPRRGGDYGVGCHNHLEELETLCRRCHGKVSGAQRRARTLGLCDAVHAGELIQGGLPIVAGAHLAPPAPATEQLALV